MPVIVIFILLLSFTSCTTNKIQSNHNNETTTTLDQELYSFESHSNHLNKTTSSMEDLILEMDQLSEVIETKEKSNAQLKEQLAGLSQENHTLSETLKKQKKNRNYSSFYAYTVQKGDTLQSIAYQAYQTNRAWLALYEFNKKQLTNGPDLLEEGQRLLIP